MNTAAYATPAIRGRRLTDLLRSSAQLVAEARLRWLLVACAALGAATFVAFPSGLGYDPWAWMVWGRELTHLELSTAGGPAFKPLAVLLAAGISWSGHAGLALWLIAARTAALFAPALAFRIVYRLAGGVAALLSACVLALSLVIVTWATLEGYMEPALIVLVLLAVERHLEGRPGQAFMFGSIAALARPEIWPFLILYAGFNWRSRPGLRPVFAAVLVLIPAVWIAPDLIASHGKDTAGARAGIHRPTLVLEQTILLLGVPGVAALLAACVLAVRRADKRLLTMIGAGLAWVGVIAILGTPQVRYVMAPVGLLVVPAGVGGAWLIRAAKTPRARALLVICAVAALPFPFMAARGFAGAQPSFVSQFRDLPTALAKAGGPRRVLAPGAPIINPNFQAALAWQLDIRLARVQRAWQPSSWTAPAVVFRTRGTIASGPPPALARRGLRLRVLARTSQWTVLLAEPGPRR
jgi:hypothetical protein